MALVEASDHDADMCLSGSRGGSRSDARSTCGKMELPPHIKDERKRVAADKLKLSWATLFNVIFMDEMRMVLMPPIKEKVIFMKRQQIFAAEDACLNGNRKHEKLIVIHANS